MFSQPAPSVLLTCLATDLTKVRQICGVRSWADVNLSSLHDYHFSVPTYFQKHKFSMRLFFFSFFFFLLRKCCLSRWVPSIWIKITAESTFYMTLEACSHRKVTAGSQQYTFLSWKFTTLPRVSSHLSHWAGSIILVLSMVQISFLVSVGNHRKIWNVLGFWVFITV